MESLGKRVKTGSIVSINRFSWTKEERERRVLQYVDMVEKGIPLFEGIEEENGNDHSGNMGLD